MGKSNFVFYYKELVWHLPAHKSDLVKFINMRVEAGVAYSIENTICHRRWRFATLRKHAIEQSCAPSLQCTWWSCQCPPVCAFSEGSSCAGGSGILPGSLPLVGVDTRHHSRKQKCLRRPSRRKAGDTGTLSFPCTSEGAFRLTWQTRFR